MESERSRTRTTLRKISRFTGKSIREERSSRLRWSSASSLFVTLYKFSSTDLPFHPSVIPLHQMCVHIDVPRGNSEFQLRITSFGMHSHRPPQLPSRLCDKRTVGGFRICKIRVWIHIRSSSSSSSNPSSTMPREMICLHTGQCGNQSMVLSLT